MKSTFFTVAVLVNYVASGYGKSLPKREPGNHTGLKTDGSYVNDSGKHELKGSKTDKVQDIWMKLDDHIKEENLVSLKHKKEGMLRKRYGQLKPRIKERLDWRQESEKNKAKRLVGKIKSVTKKTLAETKAIQANMTSIIRGKEKEKKGNIKSRILRYLPRYPMRNQGVASSENLLKYLKKEERTEQKLEPWKGREKTRKDSMGNLFDMLANGKFDTKNLLSHYAEGDQARALQEGEVQDIEREVSNDMSWQRSDDYPKSTDKGIPFEYPHSQQSESPRENYETTQNEYQMNSKEYQQVGSKDDSWRQQEYDASDHMAEDQEENQSNYPNLRENRYLNDYQDRNLQEDPQTYEHESYDKQE